MKKNQSNIRAGLLILLCILLLAGAAALLMRFLRLKNETMELDQQYQQEIEENSTDIEQWEAEETPQEEIPETPAPTVTPSSEVQGILIDLSDCSAGQILTEQQLYLENPGIYFTAQKIIRDDYVHQRMNGVVPRDGGSVELEDLRYLKLLIYNQEGQIQVGELVVNKAISQKVLDGFLEKFQSNEKTTELKLEENCWTGTTEETIQRILE